MLELNQLSEGARINDVVLLGIPKKEANLDALNLAQVLIEGNKVVVLFRGEEGGVIANDNHQAITVSGSGQAGKVNINTAGEAELVARLPGIGPVYPKLIVEYWTANGPFRSIQELTEVSGIGPKTFENLKN